MLHNNIIISANIWSGGAFWNALIIGTFACLIIIIVTALLIKTGKLIINYTILKTATRKYPVIVFKAHFAKHHQYVKFTDLNGTAIFPFKTKKMEIKKFFQLIISRNRYTLINLIRAIQRNPKKTPNIKIPILIQHNHNLFFYYFFANCYNHKTQILEAIMFQKDMTNVSSGLLSDCHWRSKKTKSEAYISNLELINAKKNENSHKTNLHLKLDKIAEAILPSKSNKTKNTLGIISKLTKAVDTEYQNVFFISVQQNKQFMIHQRIIQTICNQLFADGQNHFDNLKWAMEHVFKQFYIKERTFLYKKQIACFIVQYPHKYIYHRRFFIERWLKKRLFILEKQFKVKFITEESTKVFKNKYQFFEFLPSGFFINDWIKSMWFTKSRQNDSFLTYNSRSDVIKWQSKTQKRKNSMLQNAKRIKIRYRSAKIFNYLDNSQIGSLVQSYNDHVGQSIMTLSSYQLKKLNKALIIQCPNFAKLSKMLNLDSQVEKYNGITVFFPIAFNVFLKYRTGWLAFFRENKNFIPCFQNVFQSIYKIKIIIKLCNQQNLKFGVFNFSILDPINCNLARSEPSLQYFFVNERSVNYMIKFHKYFIPGLANMGDLASRGTKIIFPYHKNEFYLYKFSQENVLYFYSYSNLPRVNDDLAFEESYNT